MRLKALLRIARWEVTRSAGGLDRRTLAIAGVAIGLVALVAPLVMLTGVGLEDDLYRVDVDESSPYYDVVDGEDSFVIVDDPGPRAIASGDIELRIDDTDVTATDTRKGQAARQALQDAVIRYNEHQLRAEFNETAAFPVDVALSFEDQAGLGDLLGVETDDEPEADPGDGPNGDTADDTGDDPADDPADGVDDDPADDPTDPFDDDEDEGGPLDGFGPLSEDGVTGSPAELSAPFPFQSLVLAFLFIIPLNFLIQVYGSSILSERVNRRGELLLVAPVSRYDIIAGKTLPYFAGAMAIEAVLAVGFVFLVRGELGGLLSILALTPLVLLFLGAMFLGAMFARSFAELTFVTISITVGLTAYAFVPAIFTDVNEIALISPLTLVVRDLQAQSVALGEIAFSVTPPLLVAGVCFALGSGLYREEDMFAQRSIPGRLLDALTGPIRTRWHVGLMTAALIPFVFVAQLFAIALLFPLEAVGGIAIVLILVVVAITEELAKSLHIYGAYEHGRFDRGLKTAVGLGAISGVGFFLGEKIALLAQLVGLPDLAIGEAGLLGGVAVGPLLFVFLLFPLALHVITAAISAVGASRDRRSYAIAVVLAMVIHFAYNMTVVVLLV